MSIPVLPVKREVIMEDIKRTIRKIDQSIIIESLEIIHDKTGRIVFLSAVVPYTVSDKGLNKLHYELMEKIGGRCVIALKVAQAA